MLCPKARVRQNPITHKVIQTPCGKCVICRINYRLPWEYRLYNELKKHNFCGSFLTMTYSDDKYDVNKGLNYRHIKTYFDELRKDGFEFKYFCVGEYGEQTARCHWHTLLFGVPFSARELLFKRWSKWCYYPNFICAPITTSRIRYCLKYLDKESVSVKDWEDNTKINKFEFLLDSCKLMYSESGFQRPRSYCSKGIGKDNFLNRFQEVYDNGRLREGFLYKKLSKYQIDLLSRNDVCFQERRDQFKNENSFYQHELVYFGSEYNLKLNSLNQSLYQVQSINLKEQQSGQHFTKLFDSDIERAKMELTFNFDTDFKNELKRVRFGRYRINEDLARLALS